MTRTPTKIKKRGGHLVVFRTNLSSVPIAGLHSLSPQGNKNSSNLKDLPTRLNDVHHVAEPTKHGILTVTSTATVPNCKEFTRSITVFVKLFDLNQFKEIEKQRHNYVTEKEQSE